MFHKLLFLMIAVSGLVACSTVSDRDIPVSRTYTGSPCGPNCSQAFLLGTHRPALRPAKPVCNPDCP